MNRQQWFVCAGMFFMLAMVLANWSGVTGFAQPDTVTWAIGRIYAIATWFCFGLAGICFLCGLLEGFEMRKNKNI